MKIKDVPLGAKFYVADERGVFGKTLFVRIKGFRSNALNTKNHHTVRVDDATEVKIHQPEATENPSLRKAFAQRS